MAGNSGGPWGGGGNNGGGGDGGRNNGGGRKPGNDGPNIPEIDDLVNKGREQLRVLMGGGGRGSNGTGGDSGGNGPKLTRGTVGLGILGLVALWLFASFYTVRPEERSVELFLGTYYKTGEPGLNFAPWPVVTREVLAVSTERTVEVGGATGRRDPGLMLTGDENIVDIDFQIVWNIVDPQLYLFSLADPPMTIAAVSESAMREIISQSELAPILNRDRGAIAERLRDDVQASLD
ncbi:protease modulator HflK, partial [Yoonia sp.]|uniref:protease modulator HflK n=1 Tax=Yoonia sp. TaxID=2212373 RepID=UPI003A4E2556